ncbi:hypothetical protein EB052_01860, partial [bacterium]|nr:hypothetical protein [bacterium]
MTKPKPLRVLQLGESQILLQLARSVKDCRSSAMQKLIGRMIETCRSSSLVGLSAPQVGRSIRLFIILSKPTLAYPDAPLMIEPIVVVNPEEKSLGVRQFAMHNGIYNLMDIVNGQLNLLALVYIVSKFLHDKPMQVGMLAP